MDVKKLLIQQSERYQTRPMLMYKDRQITFPQIRDTAFGLANHLLKHGISPDDNIALYLPNIPETLMSFLGVFSLGATVIPFDFMLTQDEIIQFVTHSRTRALILQPKKGIDIDQIKKACPTLSHIITLGEETAEAISWDRIVLQKDTREPSSPIDPGHLAAIFYTSGSTGHPKGVMLNYAHLDSPMETMDYFLKITDKDIFVCAGVPFSHIAGVDYILLMLCFASPLVLMERFQPLEFLHTIERYRGTIFCIVPAMFVAILSLKGQEKFDLSSLRWAVVFGAPSSPVLLERFKKMCPESALLNGWGMTETSAPNTYSPNDIHKIHSIGGFSPYLQAKIVDAEGNRCAVNAQGELWVKGKGVMRGYYQEEELTKEVLTEDGWLKTGDIAYCDKDGLFYIVGRKKDMIKVAGEIVFSAEVEEKIQRHPKIKEVAVIGMPDALRGEVPKAFIVLKENEQLSLQDLREFLRKFLAHFKVPHHFEFVASLPKNRTGKIDKQALQRHTTHVTRHTSHDTRQENTSK
ncbi:MAG: acyl--CoA ligase [Candidatus Omnitrophica bacterium]|nr:acyl--CoA ligase [Candidatus Omnitrophota bacterium]